MLLYWYYTTNDEKHKATAGIYTFAFSKLRKHTGTSTFPAAIVEIHKGSHNVRQRKRWKKSGKKSWKKKLKNTVEKKSWKQKL